MKKLTPKQYAQALYESLKGTKDHELKERIGNFLELVRQRKDIRLLNKIFNNFVEIYQRAEGILDAEVISAKPLVSQVRQEILAWIKSYTGRVASLNEQTDEALLGGAVIKFGYTVVDASLKNTLNKLRSSLNQ